MDEFEKKIADVITKKLEDGVVESLVEERLEECIKDSLKDIFSWSGDGKKLINKKLSETMVPIIENHDFNQYLTKMDTILTEIINQTTLTDNKTILENFKGLMKEPEKQEIKLSEIFEKYCVYVSKEVDTGGLEAHCDDSEPHYDDVTASMEVEHIDKRWPNSSFEDCNVDFVCEEDERLNCQIKLYRYIGKAEWSILRGCEKSTVINSIRELSDFDILLIQIERGFVKIIMDTENKTEEVEPEKTPEWSLS